MKKLVAVPVYNEERYIRGVIEKIRGYHPCDILIINDGSTDGSGAIIESIKDVVCITHLTHPQNIGYGQSVIDAFKYAIEKGYDTLVTIDCDEQHEPKYIPELFAQMEGVDIRSCSRYLRESKDDHAPPPDRYAINMKMTEIINRITGYHLTDSFCGMKGYRVAALKQLNLRETGYAFPLEFWIQARHFGLTVKEFPISRIYKDQSRSFGGKLDNPEVRLAYYHKVIERELKRWSISLPSEPTPTT